MKGAVLGIVALSSILVGALFLVFSERPQTPIRAEEDFRQFAREFSKEFPEGTAALVKFAAAIGDESIAARYNAAETKLRADLTALTIEKARQESIINAQRALVADVMREGMRLQEEANKDTDMKNFWLGVVSSIAASGILYLGALLLRGPKFRKSMG
jgi:hypothetical protein